MHKPTKIVSLPDLVEGEVDLDCGIRISPVFSNGKQKRLVAIRMSHDIQDYGETLVGTCNKILPIRQARRGRGRLPKQKLKADHWTLHLGDEEELTLYPSISCPQHAIHGYLRDGVWSPMREWAFEHLTEEQYQLKIQRAEDLIREYGGGYEGAVLALASKIYTPYKYDALHVTRPLKISATHQPESEKPKTKNPA